VTASIIVTFDPSKSIGPTTSGLTINATNLPPNTEFAYDAAADTLIIATKPTTGVCEVVAGGWCAFIGDGSQAFPFLDELSFWADNGGEWVPQHATLNIGLAGAVPEPSTWTLTLIGFGGMAWPLRRGRWGARRGGACLRPGGSARERRRTISPA